MSLWRETTPDEWELEIPLHLPLLVFKIEHAKPWEAWAGREFIGKYPSAEEAKRAAVSWLRLHLRQALDAIANEEGQEP
jgi:hypothetical protein